MSQITRKARRTVYQNRWMKVHEDDVLFPSGRAGIFGVVDKPDFALIVPQHEDGRFQLVEQYRYPVGGRFWEFPQGSWENAPGTDPQALALTELAEETGFRAAQLTPLGHLYEAYGFSNQGFHVFHATGLRPGQAARETSEADMRTAAFTRDQITVMIRSGQIKDAPSIAALGLLDLGPEPGR